MDLATATVSDLRQALDARSVSALELVRGYSARIAELDPRLHAVLELNPDAEAIAGGPLEGPLAGLPVLVKDNIDTADRMRTTAGSLALLGSTPAADAPVAARLRAAGAVILGKTNLAELCWSAVGTNAWSGTPVNPVDPRRVPGGSSSGSAVAVATGEADVALGTDTGGSVRIPAACCGVVGLKTTWGRVPVEGVYPLARSMDTVGPLGADVAAVERGMRLIEPGFTAGSGQLPVARVRPETDPPVDPAVEAAIDAALTAAGIATTQVAGLDFAAANTAGGVLVDVEAYQVNGYLLPDLARLSSYNQRNLPAAAGVNAGQEAAANRTRDSVRDWFAGLLARHPVLALPTLVTGRDASRSPC